MTFTDLPCLAQIFDALRKGQHLCHRQGRLFQELRKRADEYKALFAELGFELVHHPRDFFYFHDTENFTPLAQKMALFVFILVEDLADKGQPVERALFGGPIRFADLPHFQAERYQQLMREVDVPTPADLVKLVKSMERYGFTSCREREDEFRFEIPSYRFLDLCVQFVEQAGPRQEDDRVGES